MSLLAKRMRVSANIAIIALRCSRIFILSAAGFHLFQEEDVAKNHVFCTARTVFQRCPIRLVSSCICIDLHELPIRQTLSRFQQATAGVCTMRQVTNPSNKVAS